jgi:hypothetical protein
MAARMAGRRQDAVFGQAAPELAHYLRALTGTDFLLGTDLLRHSDVEALEFNADASEIRPHFAEALVPA